MSCLHGSGRFSLLSRVMVIGLVSGLMAACSSDTMRFAGDPFGNPFASNRSEPLTTGSINPDDASSSGIIEASPLAAPGSAPPQVISAQTSAPARNQQRSTGPAGWTALGGTPIVVREGQTLEALSNRYNVPTSAILSANNLQGPADVRPGSTVVIPVYNAVGTQTASAQPAQTRNDASPAREQTQSGQSSDAPPAQPSVAPPPRPRQLASAAGPATQPQTRPEAQTRQQNAAASAPEAAPRVQQASAPQPQPEASQPNATAAGLDFRWPARGRVIAGFGTGGNEGINIALPEGTPVRAAEGGTVAYAGSELKGYGNLILIRHDDGYVSAYAHNRDLLVKRGDNVRRGQVISNSGRTGNVNAPQLHFEIRRGSDPVDPMPYLRS
ncbi:MAG: Peptidase, M23/M37 family [Saliniramus fredricksonii]|uniref:Murein DD-endopeptidase MepM and murein hydrolase activator NlpD, contain LysM domain n=1 Tax=Saliniramus fredricksonii TaxID=1653334 RepID=A0A0P8A8E1_9HYPH|nr:peptidoglycan DD-metalloendopeptidase family protein [Saliniramus fredricksonii]KPQ11401.1 MAG: Peptidase, M23/M37 family [Saliniramus fredricksonii]SCC81949.1 Murein DD-endopeptidase MepM and murein hydrolase activator NlpD, contain LysM domain [Saliniramus fredricksonii]